MARPALRKRIATLALSGTLRLTSSRLSLDSSVIRELEPLGLLYDEDGRGMFRHACTAFQDRFFFEVVERRGGYAGFGAPNAPVRIAAQARRRPALD